MKEIGKTLLNLSFALLLFVVGGSFVYDKFVAEGMNDFLNERKERRTKVVEENKNKVLLEQQEKQHIALLKKQKEQAWDAYYKEPEDCLVYKSQEHMVECTNQRMRARQEFDNSWTAE